MLVGIVGLNGSGKDAVANILKEKYSFLHYDLGQTIRDELKKIGKNYLDRNEMIVLGNSRRKEFGSNYWVKLLLKDYSPQKKFVLTSIRNPLEAEEIISKNGIIIEVFCDVKTRFNRTVDRVKNNSNAHGDVISFEEFAVKEKVELESTDPTKQQLLKSISFAKYRINNNGSLKELEDQINIIAKELVF
ncbi:MAG: AAA family ATPase [Candidatus ainarchaeum sp.]|nr:AAA family ATPase [Candidatus ainarchaeum sp.]